MPGTMSNSTDSDTKGTAPGWDPKLLQQTQQNRQYFASLDALHSSPAYQQFVRKQYKPSERNAITERMRVYADLRCVDPSGFQKVWDDPDLQSYDTFEASHMLLCLDYVCTYLLSAALVATFVLPECLGTRFLLTLWLLLDLSAILKGYTSFIGMYGSMFLVHGEQEFVCPPWKSMLLRILETFFVVGTVGLGAMVSTVSRCTSAGKQSVCEMILGVRPVCETHQPVMFNKYATTSARTPAKKDTTPIRLAFDNSPRRT